MAESLLVAEEGESRSTRQSLGTHFASLTAGDDAENNELLLDISETGINETKPAVNRTNQTCLQTRMEQGNSQGSHCLSEKDREKSQDPHAECQQHLHQTSSQNLSITIGAAIPPSHYQRHNPFDFLPQDLLQSPNPNFRIGQTAVPNFSNLDPYDPLNFGDPTFISSYISPSASSSPLQQNQALHLNQRNRPLLRGSGHDQSTEVLRKLAPYNSRISSGLSLASLNLPGAASGSGSYINQSSVSTDNSVLQGFERQAGVDIRSVIPSQASLLTQRGQTREPVASKSLLSPTAVLTTEYPSNKVDGDDRKIPDLEVIIRDYTSSSDGTHRSGDKFNNFLSFASRTSSTNTTGQGYKRGNLDISNILTAKENTGNSSNTGVNTGALLDLNPNVIHLINSGTQMRDEEHLIVDGLKDGHLHKFRSNSDNRLVDQAASLSNRRARLVESFRGDGQENLLYAEKMQGERSHWEEVHEVRLQEEAPLLEAGFSSSHKLERRFDSLNGRTYVPHGSAHSSCHLCHKTGVTSVDNHGCTTHRNSYSNNCNESHSLRKNAQEDPSNFTRGAVDSERNFTSREGGAFSRQLSPLSRFLENGGGRSETNHGPSLVHCHKKRMASLTDKLALRQLVSVIVLCLLFMIGEGVGGFLANSIALFTDVLHLGSDLISFIISLLAMWLANKPATRKMSFGYHRAEVLGALFSVFIIWLVSGVLCYIAIERIVHEHYKDVKPDEMLITASLGVVFNIIMGIVLHSEMCCRHAHSHNKFGHGHSHGGTGHGHSHGSGGHSHTKDDLLDVATRDRGMEGNFSIHQEGFDYQRLDEDIDVNRSDQQLRDVASMTMEPVDEESTSDEDHACRDEAESLHKHKNINVRAAFIHVVGDIIQSLGVLVAALIIKFTTDERYRLADPICTFLFSLLVLITTVTILRDAVLVIMEGVPRDLSTESLRKELAALNGVVTVHSLHIWALTLDRNVLSAHLAVENSNMHDRVLSDAIKLIQDKHHFFHSTIQVELYDENIMKKCKECLE